MNRISATGPKPLLVQCLVPKIADGKAKGRRSIATLLYGMLFTWSVCAQSPAVSSSPDSNKIEKRLIGTWRLMRYVDTPVGAEPIYAFGEHPVGQFLFTEDGNFSINIMRNPPDPTAVSIDIDPDACVPAWYCSYFGTYRLAETGRQWITHVEGGNIPSYIGTNQTRSFELTGDRLLILESYEEAGRTVRSERALERVR